MSEKDQKNITPKQSNEWDVFYEKVMKNPGKRLDGFPFNVRFPRMYAGRKYQIILVSGEMLIATVDDSREFSSEGLEWKTRDGNKTSSTVAAWKLYE